MMVVDKNTVIIHAGTMKLFVLILLLMDELMILVGRGDFVGMKEVVV